MKKFTFLFSLLFFFVANTFAQTYAQQKELSEQQLLANYLHENHLNPIPTGLRASYTPHITLGGIMF